MADDDVNPWERTPKQALPQTATPGQSEDDSQTGTLSKAWNAWTSRPENNAAMINFGLQMMQPIQPGQSRLGHFAESVGGGAEASQRNIATQRQQEQEDEAAALKEREQARREEETGYYGQSVRSAAAARAGGGITPLKMWQARMKARAEFDRWANAPEGVMGDDPRMINIRRDHPEIKDKATYLRSPQYQQDVKKYMDEHAAEYLEGGGVPGGGAGEAAIPPGAQPVYRGKVQTGYYYNGKYVPTE